MQEKEPSLLNCVLHICRKMLLEFGDDFCLPCEPVAWVWHKGNRCIGWRPVAIADVVDVHLPEIQCNQLAGLLSDCSTHGVSCIELAAAHCSAMSIRKKVCSTHSE